MKITRGQRPGHRPDRRQCGKPSQAGLVAGFDEDEALGTEHRFRLKSDLPGFELQPLLARLTF